MKQVSVTAGPLAPNLRGDQCGGALDGTGKHQRSRLFLMPQHGGQAALAPCFPEPIFPDGHGEKLSLGARHGAIRGCMPPWLIAAQPEPALVVVVARRASRAS